MSETALMFLHALSGLHPGSGTALGVVDLPIQRERHTSWPVIPGSSLKGVLRASGSRVAGADSEEVLSAFGPSAGASGEHAGAVSISDAGVVAFPVRSLSGVFAWVTSPSVLRRVSRDAAMAGMSLPDFPEPGEGGAACASDSPLLVDGDGMMLEEFEFQRMGDADGAAEWIAQHATDDATAAEQIRKRLVVIHDDDFSHFVRNATEVVARIGLDYETKTVRGGALFYEEYLPPETLFCAIVNCSDSRRATHSANAAQVMSWMKANIPDVLQIGGGETIGKGLCGVNLVVGGAGD